LLEYLEGRAEEYHMARLGPMRRAVLSPELIGRLQALKELPSEEFLSALQEIVEFDISCQTKMLLERAVRLHRHGLPLALALKWEQDGIDFEIEAVSLLSIHASKGLEFPIVFIAGCDHQVLPWKDADYDEERRIFYVGLTRASERLFITSTRSRRIYGKATETGPSPFVKEIMPYLVKKGPDLKARKPRRRSKQKRLF
jgi:superfamily I DNA/RNA helicase